MRTDISLYIDGKNIANCELKFLKKIFFFQYLYFEYLFVRVGQK